MPSYTHYSWTLIPHMSVRPESIHLHKNSLLVLHLPLWASTRCQIRNSQSSVAGAGLSLGENHFPIDPSPGKSCSQACHLASSTKGLTTRLFHKLPLQFSQGEDNNNNNRNSVNSRVTTTTGIWVWTSKNGNRPH
jgi:hypothetical protein